VQALVGAFLFLRAETLVNSMAFRLGTGTGGFVLLSAIILAFVVYRSAAHDILESFPSSLNPAGTQKQLKGMVRASA